MLALTGITHGRRDHSSRDTLRGSALLSFCFALAAAFTATVWEAPACAQGAVPDQVAAAAPVHACAS